MSSLDGWQMVERVIADRDKQLAARDATIARQRALLEECEMALSDELTCFTKDADRSHDLISRINEELSHDAGKAE